ncbi:MAG: glutamine--fructose-6-phosphate transaminase (isomerizing) [Cryomorphaceae bacterium]|nr:glutamine--fructose-6-phosphate transaminase (isomerizing) [Cryomorphaceae bacterium]
MCGIVGYLGTKEAYPILINGLKRLEYRGYDSAGLAIHNGTSIAHYKKKGKVSKLEQLAEGQPKDGNLGIAHTRWATHGEPNDVNSHPHTSQSGRFFMIHNGIIENYDAIKEALKDRGFTFQSETDTEVLVNLIEDIFMEGAMTLEKAVQAALNQVNGAYAIAIIDNEDPDMMVVARLGSPLVVGLDNGNFYVASDATPFVEYTKKAVYLEDGEMAVLRRNNPISVFNIESNTVIEPYVHQLTLDIEQIEKGGYEHFMLKEIYEQSRSIYDSLRGRLLPDEGKVIMRGVSEYKERFLKADRIIVVACGTSWHAGLVAEYIFEELARIPVEVEYASEFRYRNPIISEKDVVIAISQSGETADTLAAIKMAKQKGATIFGVCNIVGSSIARETHAGAFTHAGPEIGVASTKAFTAQVAVLALMAIKIGYERGSLAKTDYIRYLHELNRIPDMVEEMLSSNDDNLLGIAKTYANASNFLYLGRGVNFPVALEGALKLKEISYIHAEGYPAAEMKHGPIALIDENMPVVIIAQKNANYEKVVSNAQEVKARKGKIIAIVSPEDTEMRKIADHAIEVPETFELLSPLLTTIPLQLLSYHIAVIRGCDVDQPRNLAKSVTVE